MIENHPRTSAQSAKAKLLQDLIKGESVMDHDFAQNGPQGGVQLHGVQPPLSFLSRNQNQPLDENPKNQSALQGRCNTLGCRPSQFQLPDFHRPRTGRQRDPQPLIQLPAPNILNHFLPL
jgi:hypothetical protein